MAIRNPSWSRDELIVTLEFYLRHKSTIPNKQSPEITELSDFLNRLQSKLGGDASDTFRNVNGVYMKLMNFRRFDPAYTGKGLERGNKDEEVVWNLFKERPNELRKVSESIRSLVQSEEPLPSKEMISDDEEEGAEGQVLTRTHRYRERNTKLVKKKKEKVLEEEGNLTCEVCGFNFVVKYGERGDGFIECHHTKPVSDLKAGEKTRVADLSLLCSNCHRMIHRRRPWISIDELKQLLSH
jgi:5-methylcytosine-specific restriction protein A